MKKSKSFNGTLAISPGLEGIKYKIFGLVQRDYGVLNMKSSALTDYIVNNTKHTHTQHKTSGKLYWHKVI